MKKYVLLSLLIGLTTIGVANAGSLTTIFKQKVPAGLSALCVGMVNTKNRLCATVASAFTAKKYPAASMREEVVATSGPAAIPPLKLQKIEAVLSNPMSQSASELDALRKCVPARLHDKLNTFYPLKYEGDGKSCSINGYKQEIEKVYKPALYKMFMINLNFVNFMYEFLGAHPFERNNKSAPEMLKKSAGGMAKYICSQDTLSKTLAATHKVMEFDKGVAKDITLLRKNLSNLHRQAQEAIKERDITTLEVLSAKGRLMLENIRKDLLKNPQS